VVLGTVQNSLTPIVTTDDIVRWVEGALVDELSTTGYEARTIASFPDNVAKGVHLKVEKLDIKQQADGLILQTDTSIGLAVDIWKDGRLVKTLTSNVSRQDQGFDRSGSAISVAFRAILQSALEQLMPSIVQNLE
jgi:hypothetical protein